MRRGSPIVGAGVDGDERAAAVAAAGGAAHFSALGVAHAAAAVVGVAADGALLRIKGLLEGAALPVLKEGEATVAKTQEPRVEFGEVFGDVSQVAAEDFGGAVVAGGVDDLGHVDDGGAAGGDEDVEGREVTVDLAAAEQQADLAVDFAMQELGDVGGEFEVGEAGGGGASFVDEQLHQQYIVIEEVGLGNADAGVEGFGEGLVLHVAPALLDQLLAVVGALAHGPLVTGVAGLVAPFGVAGGGLEGALFARLVDLRRDQFALALDDKDRGLFAAHEPGTHCIDDAIVEELLQAVVHPGLLCVCAAASCRRSGTTSRLHLPAVQNRRHGRRARLAGLAPPAAPREPLTCRRRQRRDRLRLQNDRKLGHRGP